MELTNIKLVIGLGNPDSKYKNTYHNAGHLFIDFIKSASHELTVLKSSVWMNQSGAFVKKELKKKNLKPANLLIAHDDSDLVLGKFKLSFGRGSAGHKGSQDTINQLKTNKFWRLRIGIRPLKEKKRSKAERFVLKKISPINKKILESVFEKAVQEIKNPD